MTAKVLVVNGGIPNLIDAIPSKLDALLGGPGRSVALCADCDCGDDVGKLSAVRHVDIISVV